MLMLIEEQNKKGGLLGKQIEPVVVDPASNWPLFAEKARELISKEKVAATFGCWTSVSRKSVLPVFEELNSILFYPVQYEGEESSKNVFYTGAAPNQQAIPTGRRSWPTSRSSARPARRRRWSRPSTATPTCRSTRSWVRRESRPPTSRWWHSRSARKSWPVSTPSRCSAIWPRGTT